MEDKFAEIVIGDSTECGAPEPLLIHAQRMPSDLPDGKNEIFAKMRQIALNESYRSYGQLKIVRSPEQRVTISGIFYKQAVFMKDFTDDFTGNAQFFSYYPFYQLMNSSQLRTYFTWRTQVRKGTVVKTSLSYAFLYIYELLNNIGADSPGEGLELLEFFWKSYGALDSDINKYMEKWLKDYRVYYGLPCHLPERGITFETLCTAAKYDVTRSPVYKPDCFRFVFEKLKETLESAGLSLDGLIFRFSGNRWTPFEDALFCSRLKQPDRFTLVSEKEMYWLRNNKWTCGKGKENNKNLAAYILKRTEIAVKKQTGQNITAAPKPLDSETAEQLDAAGVSLEKTIDAAAAEFYYNLSRVKVAVDFSNLSRIRRESLDIQEKLIINNVSPLENSVDKTAPAAKTETFPPSRPADEWECFMLSLTPEELDAISIILEGDGVKNLPGGVMPEVMVDGINQKAYDIINDNVLEFDGKITIYPEYREKIQCFQN